MPKSLGIGALELFGGLNQVHLAQSTSMIQDDNGGRLLDEFLSVKLALFWWQCLFSFLESCNTYGGRWPKRPHPHK